MNRIKFTMDSGNTFTRFVNDVDREYIIKVLNNNKTLFIGLDGLILTQSKIESIEITADEENQQ